MDSKVYKDVWDVICETEGEKQECRKLSSLMEEIHFLIKDFSLSELAAKCSLKKSEAKFLIDGRISKFSVEELENILKVLQK